MHMFLCATGKTDNTRTNRENKGENVRSTVVVTPTDILLDFIEERHHRLTVFEIFLFTMKENKH